jgi:hypothetical protein
LRSKGADAQNVSHRTGIPTFGEHRNRDHAADGGAKVAGFADRVHELAQEFLIRNVVGGERIAGALNVLATEPLDFIGGQAAEIVVKGVACFQLLAVDQQGVRPGERVAGGLVEVAE